MQSLDGKNGTESRYRYSSLDNVFVFVFYSDGGERRGSRRAKDRERRKENQEGIEQKRNLGAEKL